MPDSPVEVYPRSGLAVLEIVMGLTAAMMTLIIPVIPDHADDFGVNLIAASRPVPLRSPPTVA